MWSEVDRAGHASHLGQPIATGLFRVCCPDPKVSSDGAPPQKAKWWCGGAAAVAFAEHLRPLIVREFSKRAGITLLDSRQAQ